MTDRDDRWPVLDEEEEKAPPEPEGWDSDELDEVPATAVATASAVVDHDPDDEDPDELPALRPPDGEHAEGALRIPDGYNVVEGSSDGRRSVGIVVARFNAEITARMLETALEELESAGIGADAVTIVPVPGAFELPLAAMALAKTRRYACIIALGCVIRGETAHFDYVAGEAASGLQLAALETGVPVSFGVLTTDTVEQAEARTGRAADAVRSALEMADLFNKLRLEAAGR